MFADVSGLCAEGRVWLVGVGGGEDCGCFARSGLHACCDALPRTAPIVYGFGRRGGVRQGGEGGWRRERGGK